VQRPLLGTNGFVVIVFDDKENGQYKSQLVAGGHMTDVPLESIYSSVISHRSQ